MQRGGIQPSPPPAESGPVKPSARDAIAAASSCLRIFSAGACRIRKAPTATPATATTSKYVCGRNARISSSRPQTIARVGVFTRPTPMTARWPRARSTVAVDERPVVNLVGLLPRQHRRRVEAPIRGIRLRGGECVADRLRILGGEHDPHDLAPKMAVLEDFLTDQLPLAVAIGRQPDTARGTQGGFNRLQLTDLVPPARRFGSVKPVRTQQNSGPAAPAPGFTSSGSSRVIR